MLTKRQPSDLSCEINTEVMTKTHKKFSIYLQLGTKSDFGLYS